MEKMKKTISRVAVAMLLAQTFSPVATYAHNDQVSNVLEVTSTNGSIIESLTSNQWLRQIVVVSEEVNQDHAKEIVQQLERYQNNVLEGLVINHAQIQIVETLEGLATLPEGTDGAELDSYLTASNILYLKANPSGNNGSAHFVLQQAALLMNQAIFSNIFSTSDYNYYYNYDKGLVSYGHMNQLDFIAESLAYYTYNSPYDTELGKTVQLVWYLYYLYYEYVPKEILASEKYIEKIVEYPTDTYDTDAVNEIIAKLELFDVKFLEALANSGAKLKLVNSLDDNTVTAQNELILEIGKQYTSDWSSDELLRQIVLWVDASIWFNTSESLDFKYVYDYSYAERHFATDADLNQVEFFSEAIARRLTGKSIGGGKMQPVHWYVYYLLRDFKAKDVDYTEQVEIDPIEISEEENALLDELIPQVVEVTAGATDYDVAEVERIIERLKRYGAEVFQGMIYSEIKIRLTTGPITDEPEMDYLADVTPRGWPDNLTWADVPGAGGNPVFSRIGHSYMGMGHSTVNLEHHETAHILDYYLFDYVSISDEFVALHEKEAVSLYGNDGYMEFYPEEYFAEALTFYFLSGHKRAMLKRLAPETYEFIDNLYSNYKAVDPFDSVVDAEKTSYINKILVIDTNDAEAKEYAIKSLKRIDTNFLKALARLNIKYSLSTLGKFESLEKITTVNPILNHVARDVEKYVLNNATESEEFKKVFEEEGGVVNQPKTPKSLFVYQEFIANDIKEFFAETFAMYYQSGGTRYDLGAKAPGAWIFIEDADIALNNQPPVDDGGSTPNPNPGDDDGSTPNPNPGGDDGSTLIPNPSGGSSSGGSGNTSGSSTGETTSPKTETTTTETVLDNGTIIKETIHENGEKVVIIETTNGSKSETTISAAGNFIASIAISAKELTQAGNQPIVLPIPEVKVSNDIATAPIIKLTAVNNDETAPVKVIVPVQNVSVGTVIMIVHEDGTTEVIKKTKFSNGQLTFEAYPNVTYKVVDNSKSFDDVEATSWYSDAVQYAAAREWVIGTDEKGFSPNSTLTREQFVTILHRISNADSASLASVAYNDVDSDAYYADAVKWAKDSGIMTGQSDGSFGIGQAISREDFAVVLWRSVGSPSAVSTPENFTDFNNTSSYATHALAWAVENGLFLGKGDGRLDPKGSATRAEATKLLMYFEENILK